ncbi:MAG: hypothetical protein Q4E32_09375, partial [Bacteroidales bacterium]|nr:hypothetical protein [Bacteroidales bacterium]
QSFLTVLVQLFHCGGTKISLRRYKSSTAVKLKFRCGGTNTPLHTVFQPATKLKIENTDSTDFYFCQ